MKISKELRIGISTIAILFCAYWGVTFLKSANIFETREIYHLSLDDATGIVISTSINVKGVKIGAVNKVELEGVNQKVNVTLSVKSKYTLPNDSYITMRQVGLMDSPILELVPGSSTTTYKDGDLIEFRREPGMIDLMDNLAAQLSSVMTRVDSLAASFQTVMSKDNINSISNTLTSLESGTANLNGLVESQGDKIARIVSNFEQMSETFNSSSPEIKEILGNFNHLSDTLNTSIPTMMNQLNGLLDKVNSPEGTVGKLLESDQMYNEIDSLAKSINVLMNDIQANPDKYVKISVFERQSPQEKYDRKKEKERIKALKREDRENK